MSVRILQGDVRDRLRELPDESVHCVVTSPPYWGLRDYGMPEQIGLEPGPVEFVETMVEVFREVRRVLRADGTAWVNMGDTYTSGNRATYRSGASDNKGQLVQNDMPRPKMPAGLKPKDVIGLPWMLAFALRADGWYLRQDIIWHKPNPMPESVTDRCTKAHEYIFLLSKSERYYFDQEAILEPVSPNTHARLSQDVAAQVGSERAHAGGKTNGNMKAVARKAGGTPRQDGERWNENNGKGFVVKRAPGVNPKAAESSPGSKQNDSFSAAVCMPVTERNKRSVWTITTKGFAEAHFATFPPELPEFCIKAGCPPGGVVLDPFGGAGTTGLVADRLQRDAILIELNPEYAAMAERRIRGDSPLFAQVGT